MSKFIFVSCCSCWLVLFGHKMAVVECGLPPQENPCRRNWEVVKFQSRQPFECVVFFFFLSSLLKLGFSE